MKKSSLLIIISLVTFFSYSNVFSGIPTQGLVAFYPFTGNAADSSGNGLNGTVAGAILTADRFGNPNQAYSFNGYSSVIRCGDILDSVFSSIPVAKFSVSGWAYTRTYKSLVQDGGYMFGKNAGGPGPYQWGLGHYQGIVVGSAFSDTNGLTNYLGISNPMTTNQWFHYVYIFDGSQAETQRVKLYINGDSTNSSILWHVGTLGTTTVNTNQQFTFGATHSRDNPAVLSNFYDGILDDIRIYNRVLNNSEIQSLYHEGGWPKILQPDLVAYYPLNGNANDSSGYGYNATIAGATPTDDRFGNANSAYSFNGSNSMIRCGDILDSVFAAPVAKFTVTGWSRTRTYGTIAGGGGFVVGKNGGGGTHAPAQWNVTSTDIGLYGAVFSDTTANNYLALMAPPVAKNQWFHFALVFDGTQSELQRVKLYVNAVSANSSVYQHVGTLGTRTTASQQNVTMGASHPGGNPTIPENMYDGDIDDIRIYDRVLSDAEIQSMYNAGGWPLPSNGGLVAYYPFNGNAKDSSGNGLDGTVAGAVLTTDRFGMPNSAYSFNGSSSVIRCGDILDSVFSAVPVAKFSVSGWAYTRSYKSLAEDGGYMFGKNAGGPGPYQWGLGHYQGLVVGSAFSDTNGLTNYIGVSNPMTTNQWFHYVYIFDGSQPETQRVKLYINGDSTNSSLLWHVGTLGTTTVNTHQQFTFGATHSRDNPAVLSNFYDGILDDIRIYNKVLSSSEIQTLYHEKGWPRSMQPGLVAYYPFNGNANDSTGNGFNGTVIGATLVPDRFGKQNSAYYFNGSTSYIRLGDILDSVFCKPTAQFSISGWAKTNVPGSIETGGGFIIGKESGGELSGAHQWSISQVDTRLFGYASSDSNMQNFLEKTNPVDSSGWFHFAYIFDGSLSQADRIKLYVNGISNMTVYSQTGALGTSTQNTTQELTIGAGHQRYNPSVPNNGYNGALDDIRIYNKALTTADVQNLYHEGGWARPADPGLVAFYPFNGNAKDSSGYGFNGTVIGATLVPDRFGSPNSAYSFNGSTDYIRLGDILDSVFCKPIAQFSVSGWAKTSVPGSVSAGGGFIIGKEAGGAAAAGHQWNIEHLDTKVYTWVNSDSAALNSIDMTNPAPLNSWYHFVFTFDGSQTRSNRIKVYVNGISTMATYSQIGSLGTTTQNTSQELTIGAGHKVFDPTTPNNGFNGAIDDIRIYNRVLNDSSIQALYHERGWGGDLVNQVLDGIPADFELSANYPNPFNPSTTIRFAVPVRSQVKIEIFNILGQRVSELVNGEVGPGYYEKEWQAAVSSGLYLYRIEAVSLSDPGKHFVAARKMLLLK